MLDRHLVGQWPERGGAPRLPAFKSPHKEVVVFRPTLKRGPSPQAVALAGLALAFAALGPSAAVAKQGGTDRPIAAKQSGTNVIDVASGSFVIDVAGTRSHLGKVTAHYTGVATPSGPNTLSISGSSVEVAANGDKLYATLSASATLDAAFNAEGTLVNTFTGGTGRFANASGVETGTFSMATRSFDGVTLTSALSISLTGTVSY